MLLDPTGAMINLWILAAAGVSGVLLSAFELIQLIRLNRKAAVAVLTGLTILYIWCCDMLIQVLTGGHISQLSARGWLAVIIGCILSPLTGICVNDLRKKMQKSKY